jgi:ABC-type ATPase involved in cell division
VTSSIVELINVSTGFGGPPLLRGLSLAVSAGELIVIEGATGSGKTTLVRLLLGAQPVQTGLARVLGIDLARAGKSVTTNLRRSVGVIFQHPRFLDQESVLMNVAVPLAIRGTAGEKLRGLGTRALMDAGLSANARKRPAQLSGGEQARLQIARALVHRPQLVLADEPFAHLDPESAEAAESLLRTAHERGTTVILTTHRPTSLTERARRMRLEDGVLHA